MISRLNLPGPGSWPYVISGCGVWVGIAVGVRAWWPLLLVCMAIVAAAASRNRPMVFLLGVVGVGTVVGGLLVGRTTAMIETALPAGPVSLVVEALSHGSDSQWGGVARVRPLSIELGSEWVTWDGPAGWIDGSGVGSWKRGSRWAIETEMRPTSAARLGAPTTWRGSVVRAERIEVEGWSFTAAARATGQYILRNLDPDRSEGRALLAGFLIGDTAALGPVAEDHMRRAGLSHFVAVSGSNVALFLGLLFLVAGPLGWSSRRRALIGLVGLAFFVALIGPDPSVVRAATMAALVLVAKPFGLRPPVWTVLGGGVTLLLVLSPELALSLGFQLSVAATAGVIVGVRAFPDIRPRWVGSALGAAVAAQVAVAPVLLLAIGTVPLWSPVANVAAGPFVVAATGLGGIGAILGIAPLVSLAEWCANVVLGIAGAVAPMPQLGVGAAAAVGLVGLALLPRITRPGASIVGAVALAVSSFGLAATTEGPAFVALDVGQGDALLLLGPYGEIVMVDGGSSGSTVLHGLARHGIDAIDLLVVTHAHLDHFGGLGAVVERLPIGQLWYYESPDQGSDFDEFLAGAADYTDLVEPAFGTYMVGSIELEVIGPLRRYASANDQSLVIRALVGGQTILLTGDVEEYAQDDLGPVAASILKVPHHGAATSDGRWLVATGASIAVVSVGQNSFGHPVPELLDELRLAGMTIRRTDDEGDVVIPLARAP